MMACNSQQALPLKK
jgi:hypothetical protein